MIDICLFGREISDLVRVFGTSLRFILLSSVARGLFVRPVVVVIEGDARGGLRRDDYIVRCVAVQKIPFATRTTAIAGLFCPADATDTTIRPRRGSSSRINQTGRTSRANFPLTSFPRSASSDYSNEHDETPRGVLYRRDISRELLSV